MHLTHRALKHSSGIDTSTIWCPNAFVNLVFISLSAFQHEGLLNPNQYLILSPQLQWQICGGNYIIHVCGHLSTDYETQWSNTSDAGSRIYSNLVETQDDSSHEQHGFGKLHTHTLKGSTSPKLLHTDPIRGLTFKIATGVGISSVL